MRFFIDHPIKSGPTVLFCRLSVDYNGALEINKNSDKESLC